MEQDVLKVLPDPKAAGPASPDHKAAGVSPKAANSISPDLEAVGSILPDP